MAEPETPSPAGSRYQIIDGEQGRHLICSTAANLRLFVTFGLTVTRNELRNYPRQTIFLDGCFSGAPFHDNKNRYYSLDHHSECLRSMTLATCEQAVVMLLSGLPLGEGNWQIHANDPDLDTVLGAWALLNHTEMLKDDRELMRAVMPLIRIEGCIDAHGLDMGVLTAIPEDVYEVHKGTIDTLLATEREIKQKGQWEGSDLLAYCAGVFDRLDRMYLTDSYLSKLLEVEEISSLDLGESAVAILCRSRRGIYEAEMALKERYGKQLGVVLLHRGQNHYTLRQVNSFLHHDLTAAYQALNRRDPLCDKASGNLWGGSADIGGSPRSTGSGLTGEEIMETVASAFVHRSWWQRLLRRG